MDGWMDGQIQERAHTRTFRQRTVFLQKVSSISNKSNIPFLLYVSISLGMSGANYRNEIASTRMFSQASFFRENVLTKMVQLLLLVCCLRHFISFFYYLSLGFMSNSVMFPLLFRWNMSLFCLLEQKWQTEIRFQSCEADVEMHLLFSVCWHSRILLEWSVKAIFYSATFVMYKKLNDPGNRIKALKSVTLTTFVLLQTECPREHTIHSSTEVCSRGGERLFYPRI